MTRFKVLLVIGLLAACSPKIKQTSATNQTKSTANTGSSYKINTIAFYNLENLFDTENDPDKNDEASPMMEMAPGLRKGVYKKKVANMAKVISEIGANTAKNSPAVIGVSEVENKKVLEDVVNDPHLVKKDYGIIHYESPDRRGIDVALLYQKKIFQPISSSSHELEIYQDDDDHKRYYTRDQLLVTGLLDGDTISLIVNHWPSRYGGELSSRYKREKAAALNKKIIDSLQSVNPYAKIITMGDMNDGPYNSSIKDVLNAKAEKKEVPMKGLYNPMENMQAEQGLGTIAYRDSWDLFDQMILTKSLLKKNRDSYFYYKAGIYNPNYLSNPSGRYKGYPFRSFSDGSFTGGYSDHFPVYIYLVKEKKN